MNIYGILLFFCYTNHISRKIKGHSMNLLFVTYKIIKYKEICTNILQGHREDLRAPLL